MHRKGFKIASYVLFSIAAFFCLISGFQVEAVMGSAPFAWVGLILFLAARSKPGEAPTETYAERFPIDSPFVMGTPMWNMEESANRAREASEYLSRVGKDF